MSEALTAAGGLFTSIPAGVRRTLYGLFGLVIVLEGIFDVLPEDWSLKLIALWGVFNSLMALANSTVAPLPPPPPNGGVEPAFPDEFP
jgi:hypothetical protein